MKKILKISKDIFFPRRCPVCAGIVPSFGGQICPSCFPKLSFVKSPVCRKCGKEIFSDTMEYCRDCTRHVRSFSSGMALLNYNEVAAASMAQIKYHNKREYLDFYGQAAVKRYGRRIKRLAFDAIVPVPVHPSKMHQRGYNQAEVLAKIMGEPLGIPVIEDGLKRSRRTEPQKDLTPQERFNNLKHAFTAGNLPSSVHRVLLVDDIYTTGSTMEACTRALKQQGVNEVFCFSICIGCGR